MTDITALTNVSSDLILQAANKNTTVQTNDSFDSALATAMNMVSETNSYVKDVESEEIKFELGEATNTHDLQIAQEKANVTLQYTMAVRDKILSAYQEIMNIQI